ncbi:Uncharacterised protein [Serratia grimesii]|nr:Uncharacterised protein [Serratia grimesii]CAI2490646.1 Uncharacterised protein [Serratia grimesii]
MFNRLVRRAVFAQTDGVMGVHEHVADFHQRRHTHRITGVFHEHQEGRRVRQEAAVQRDAVGDGGHAELAHAVVDVVTRQVFIQRFGAGPHGQVARCQVSGAAEELRQHLAEGFQRVLRRLAARDVGRVSLQLFNKGFGVGFPVGRQFTVHTAFELGSQLREGLGVGSETVVPGRFFGLAGFFGVPLGINVLRDFEGGVFPAQRFAGGGHFGGAQCRTVHVVGTGLVR